ncbi:MAG: ABC transporter ATP-binding protein, partial [Gemmatimonadetes bacterium]|nr:ABC transporter ATP-binding protein [Gemmatimonadota bacterium]
FGTMDELRADAANAGKGLEEIFLRLTGDNAARELVNVLDA